MTRVTIQVDLYRLIHEKLEESAKSALYRATKHVPWAHYADEHERNRLAEQLVEEQMGELCEWIRFSPETADIAVTPPEGGFGDR